MEIRQVRSWILRRYFSAVCGEWKRDVENSWLKYFFYCSVIGGAGLSSVVGADCCVRRIILTELVSNSLFEHSTSIVDVEPELSPPLASNLQSWARGFINRLTCPPAFEAVRSPPFALAARAPLCPSRPFSAAIPGRRLDHFQPPFSPPFRSRACVPMVSDRACRCHFLPFRRLGRLGLVLSLSQAARWNARFVLRHPGPGCLFDTWRSHVVHTCRCCSVPLSSPLLSSLLFRI